MAGVLVFLMIGFFLLITVLKRGAAAGSALTGRGTPARGIVLSAARTGVRFAGTEQRQVTLDVEIPGLAPYVFSGTVSIPSNFVEDVLPGVTVELRVQSANRIAIIGPGVGLAMPPLVAAGAPNPTQPQR